MTPIFLWPLVAVCGEIAGRACGEKKLKAVPVPATQSDIDRISKLATGA
jgi:hypothetical protein